MFQTDGFTATTTIVSILISLATLVCSVYEAINQTRITESLNTHDNQIKYRLYRSVYFLFLAFIIIAAIQFMASESFKFFSHIFTSDATQIEQVIENDENVSTIDIQNAEEEGNEEATSNLKNENDETGKIESTETTEEKPFWSFDLADIIVILFEIIVSIISIIITVILYSINRKKHGEKITFIDDFFGMVVTILSFWGIIHFIIVDIVLGFHFALFFTSVIVVYIFAKTAYDSITKADKFPSRAKIKYKDQELFVYEMKDGYFLAGKRRCLFDNEEFYMLNAEGNNYRIMNSKRYIEINEENEDEKEIEELKERITQLEYRTIELKGIIEGKTKHSLLDRFIDIFR